MADGELVIKPQPGPQTALLESDCDITFFGGQGGGGKTWAALMALARWFYVSLFTGILFRRQAVDLEGAESAWEQSQRLMPALGWKGRASPVHSWRHPDSKALIEMRHMQNEGDELDHAGKAYACIVFEELTQFTAKQFWFLMSRLRSTCGVRPHVIATLNPDPEHWVFEIVRWFIDEETGLPIPSRSGVKRYLVRRADDSFDFDQDRDALEARNPGRSAMSFTFIASSLSDNPALTERDPDYGKRLDALASVDRDRLKFGRWTRSAKSGGYFREEWFKLIPFAPTNVHRWVRCWDLAATEATPNTDPDWTRGGKLGMFRPARHFPTPGASVVDEFVIGDHVGDRIGPAGVDALIERTAEADGRSVEIAFWRDPGQAGKAQAHALVAKLGLLGYAVHTIPASRDKEAYARVWSPLVEKGLVSVVDAPWTKPLLQRMQAFPGGRYKDDVDAYSLGFQVLTGSTPPRSVRVRGL